MQLKNSLGVGANDMHVTWLVIIGIDDSAVAQEPQDCGHTTRNLS
jgi:hypothetical protein